MRTSKATRSPDVRAAIALAIAALAAATACSSPSTAPAVAPSSAPLAKGPVVDFEFVALDGKPISGAAMRGRFTLVALLASYDVASQAEAQFLDAIAHHHAPRVNVAGLFLEPEESRPLVDAFARSLALDYPVGLAAAEPVGTAFEGLYHVPSLVLLDREGRIVWKHAGLLPEKIVDAVLREAEAAAPR